MFELKAKLDGLRNALIGPTVKHAQEYSPLYRRVYAQAGVDVASVRVVEDLVNLPIVDKSMLREAGRDACAYRPETVVSHVQHTSGTTGLPLLLHRSTEETQFIQDFFGRLCDQASGKDVREIILQLHTPHHGTSTPLPSYCFVMDAAITDEASVDHVFRLLGTHFDIPGVAQRIGGLAGGNLDLYLITELATLRDQRSSDHRTVQTSLAGAYVTRRRRQRLADVWGAAPLDRFSTSEVFGGATYCPHCAGHHFDPHVVAEIVDVQDRSPLGRGTGLLLLTSLYPFVQLQPMVRYATGDLFELDRDACAAPCFRFRGRINEALFSPHAPGRLLLDGAALQDALDDDPQIAREEHFPGIASPGARDIGPPKAIGSVEHRRAKAVYRLHVESQAVPHAARVAMASRLRNSILAKAPGLANEITTGAADFEVCVAPPQAMAAAEGGWIWK